MWAVALLREPYKGAFREGAPRPSDLHTPVVATLETLDIKALENAGLSWGDTGEVTSANDLGLFLREGFEGGFRR